MRIGCKWQVLIDFVYPKFCLGCGTDGILLCDECRLGLEFAEQICPMCGKGSCMGWTHKQCLKKDGLDGLICLFAYGDETVRKAIDELKFGFNREVAPLLMKDTVFESGVEFDAVVPMPLYFYRENWRGFNQAELVATQIEKGMGIRTEKWLVREKNTKQQSLLMSFGERETNLEGAFGIAEGEEVKGKKVLLVDDVFTSGASMREAARSLKKAGVRMVWGLALAH